MCYTEVYVYIYIVYNCDIRVTTLNIKFYNKQTNINTTEYLTEIQQKYIMECIQNNNT